MLGWTNAVVYPAAYAPCFARPLMYGALELPMIEKRLLFSITIVKTVPVQPAGLLGAATVSGRARLDPTAGVADTF